VVFYIKWGRKTYEIYAVIILVIGSIIAISRNINKSNETKFRVGD
jgi:hypothetical protein